MDPEDSSNFTDEDYTYEDYTDDDTEDIYSRLFLELVTLIGLISVVTNLLIVFVIVKFKKLRNDVTNILLVHLNILQAAYFFFAPLTLRVAMLIDITTQVNMMTVICAASEIEYVVDFVICLILSLLIFDWYIKLYHEDIYTKFCRVFKFIVIFVYVLAICFCVATVQFSCQSDMDVNTFLVIIAVNIIFLLFVFVMNIIHAVKKRKLRLSNNNNVGLVITNLSCLLSSPGLLTNILYIFGNPSIIALTVTTTLGFSHPICSFFYLFYYDYRFNASLKKVIRCKCNDDNEDLENLTVAYNYENGVQIS